MDHPAHPADPTTGAAPVLVISLDPALEVGYPVDRVVWDGRTPVSRVDRRAGGPGAGVARVLHAFGFDVVMGGLAGGTTGEAIRGELAAAGVAAMFTPIGRESRRTLAVLDRASGRRAVFEEPAPYVTTGELGRFAGRYRDLVRDAAAVVLAGPLPAGLPPETYATLARYAAEAGVPAVLDSTGEALRLGLAGGPAVVVAGAAEACRLTGEPGAGEAGRALLAAGAGSAVIGSDQDGVLAVAAGGCWRATAGPGDVGDPGDAGEAREARGVEGEGDAGDAGDALVAGLVPGLLLDWPWPDRLRHALALAGASAGRTATGGSRVRAGRAGDGERGVAGGSAEFDAARYERLLPLVEVTRADPG